MIEETMKAVLTINELWRLARTELHNLLNRITNELPTFRDGSPERENAISCRRNQVRAGAATGKSRSAGYRESVKLTPTMRIGRERSAVGVWRSLRSSSFIHT
jgi:hypothetical protein